MEKARILDYAVNTMSVIVAIALAIIIAGLLIQISGLNALEGLQELFKSSFGSYQDIGSTLTRTAPLLLAGLSILFAFRSGVLNIGTEGQYIAGGLFSVLVATSIPPMPSFIAIPLVIAAGFFGGMMWALVPAILKAKQNVNELLSSLMMNYVAFYLLQFLLRDWMRDKSLPVAYPVTKTVPQFARLPTIMPSTSLTASIIIAVISAVGVYFVLQKTTFGFRMRAVGKNPEAAAFSGMNINLIQFSAMLISGGLGGLAGLAEAVGYFNKVNMQFSVGYGYTGILLALMSQLNSLVLIIVSIFFAGLEIGSQGMRSIDISYHLSTVTEGVLIIMILLVKPVVQNFLSRRKQK